MKFRLNPLSTALLLAGFMPFAVQAVNAPVIADSYINSPAPTSNFGTGASLKINSSAKALLRFDLSELPSTTIAADVAKATLIFWVNTVTSAGALQVSPLTSAWTESGVTWATAPTESATIKTGITAASASGYYVLVDITNQVQDWIAAPASNFGLAIEPDAGASGTFVMIDSKENTSTSHPAYLDITLTGTGAAGPTGATGATGGVGANGANGAVGATGPTGANGTNGVAGATGATGANGTNGVAGATGATGANGTNGVAGATGATGANGTNGAAGATGPAGAAGVAGPTGATGTNGTNGATGATGPAGANGTNGATGATGPAGANGTNGSNGATGATGPAGANGTNGSNGATGATGPGVPTGGTTGQVLSKINATDYNTQWTTPSSSGSNTLRMVAWMGCQPAGSGASCNFSINLPTIGSNYYDPTDLATNQTASPTACTTLSGLYVKVSNTVFANGRTITLQKNGANTAVSCTLASGTCTDSTHSISTVQGDLLNYSFPAGGNGGTVNGTLTATILCQ